MISFYSLAIIFALNYNTLSLPFCRTVSSGESICFTTTQIRSLKTWYEARNYCEANNMILPEIYNHEEDDILNSFILEYDMLYDDIWLGGHIRNLSKAVCNEAETDCNLNLNSSSTQYFTPIYFENSTITFSEKDVTSANYICKKINCKNSCYNVYINNVDFFTATNKCLQKKQRIATFESHDDLENVKQLLKISKLFYWVNIKKFQMTWNKNESNKVGFTNFDCSKSTLRNDLCLVKQTRGFWGVRLCNDTENDMSAVVCMSRKSSEERSSLKENPYCLETLGLGLLVGIGAFLWILSLVLLGVCCCCCCRGAQTTKPKLGNKSKSSLSAPTQLPDPSINPYSDSSNVQFDNIHDDDEQDQISYGRNEFDVSEYANANH